MPIPRQEQTLTYALPEEVGISSEKENLLVNELKLRVTQGELPGAVLMVVRNHKVVIHEPIGFRDRIEQSDMQKDSIFRIASMTKPIVSICALKLMEQGKLSLEDPVSKFLPEFENIQVGVETTNLSGEKELSLVPPNKKMTIQDLMRHTSGLTYGWVKTALVDQLYESNQIWSDNVNVTEMMLFLLFAYFILVGILVWAMNSWDRALKIPGFGQ